jgi:hypothetical protein
MTKNSTPTIAPSSNEPATHLGLAERWDADWVTGTGADGRRHRRHSVVPTRTEVAAIIARIEAQRGTPLETKAT